MSYEQRDQYGGYEGNPYGGDGGYNQSGNPYASGVSTTHTYTAIPTCNQLTLLTTATKLRRSNTISPARIQLLSDIKLLTTRRDTARHNSGTAAHPSTCDEQFRLPLARRWCPEADHLPFRTS
jgi:hypothetical protein